MDSDHSNSIPFNFTLHKAVTDNQIEQVLSLINDNFDTNTVDEYGNTPFHLAAAVNIEAKDKSGLTPLILLKHYQGLNLMAELYS